MTIFARPSLPGAPPERVLFSQDPPGLPQSSLWTSWRCPGLSQEGPGAAEDHMKFTKLTCSKPGKYVYLTLWNLKKYVSGNFFTLQGPTQDPPESSPSLPGRLWAPRNVHRGALEPLMDPPGPHSGHCSTFRVSAFQIEHLSPKHLFV